MNFTAWLRAGAVALAIQCVPVDAQAEDEFRDIAGFASDDACPRR